MRATPAQVTGVRHLVHCVPCWCGRIPNWVSVAGAGSGPLVRTRWSCAGAHHGAPLKSGYSVLVRAVGDRWVDSASRAARNCSTPDLSSYEFPASWLQHTALPVTSHLTCSQLSSSWRPASDAGVVRLTTRLLVPSGVSSRPKTGSGVRDRQTKRVPLHSHPVVCRWPNGLGQAVWLPAQLTS